VALLQFINDCGAPLGLISNGAKETNSAGTRYFLALTDCFACTRINDESIMRIASSSRQWLSGRLLRLLDQNNSAIQKYRLLGAVDNDRTKELMVFARSEMRK
jgi:hypothetical protein